MGINKSNGFERTFKTVTHSSHEVSFSAVKLFPSFPSAAINLHATNTVSKGTTLLGKEADLWDGEGRGGGDAGSQSKMFKA